MNELLVWIFAMLGLIGTGLWAGAAMTVMPSIKDITLGLQITGVLGVIFWSLAFAVLFLYPQ